MSQLILPSNIILYNNDKNGYDYYFIFNKFVKGKRYNTKYKLKSNDIQLELNTFINKINNLFQDFKIEQFSVTNIPDEYKNIVKVPNKKRQYYTKSKTSNKTERLCAYYNHIDKKCNNKTYSTFCGIHYIYENKVDPSNMSFCIDCNVLLFSKDIMNKCSKCYNLKMCKGITLLKTYCTYQSLPNNDYCDKHQSYKKWKELTDSSKNICNNWIRGCWNIADATICNDCLVNNKNKIINKKDAIEEASEFNANAYDYKMCINCNAIVDTVLFSTNDMCNLCEKIMKINVDNSKIKDLFDKQYKNYIYGAQIRDIQFNLTKIDCMKYFSKKCFYCNIKKEVNGIDRLNSNMDYMKTNCVACCTRCNFMKGTILSNNFIKICQHIAKYNNMIENIKLDYSLFESAKDPNYKTYKKGAIIRDLKFNLSESDFLDIILNKCYYCGIINETKIGKCAGGIDRKNSDLDYNINNCVACCKTCNIMKGILPEKDFIDQCYLIAKNHINYIDNNLEEKLIDRFYDILSSTPKRFKPKFLHSKEYYEKRVWFGNLEDLQKIKIGLEFVENKEQKDIWNYYRYNVSSLNTFNINNTVGRSIHILVKDINTSKYLGIISLSSDIRDLECRDKYIGWNNKDKFENGKLNQVLNISTCVGLQPFAFNFNGGKLLTKLAFSKEVLNRFYEKYHQPLLGLVTTGLYGKSVQYDRLKELKFIGYTSGNSVYKITPEITEMCRNYMMINHNKNYTNKQKLYIISDTLQKLGLPREEFMTDNPKGVYFGFIYDNSKEILCSKDSNIISKKINDSSEIFNEWFERWAKQRSYHLSKQNKLQNIKIYSSTERTVKYRERLKEEIGEEKYKEITKSKNENYYIKNRDKILENYNKTKKIENNKVSDKIIINDNLVIKPDLPNNISLYRENDGNIYIQFNKVIKENRTLEAKPLKEEHKVSKGTLCRYNIKHKITTNDIQLELNKLIDNVNTKFPELLIQQYNVMNPDIWNKNPEVTNYIKTIKVNTKPDMPNNFSICNVNDTDYIQFCKKIDNKRYQYKTRINSNDIQTELNNFIDYLNMKYKLELIKDQYIVNNMNNWVSSNNIIDHTDTPNKIISREKSKKYIEKKKLEMGEEKFKEMKRIYVKELRNKEINL
jgi:hypothetical protein